MAVRATQTLNEGGAYFITFTCYKWKPLIQLASAYDVIYKWFDYLSNNQADVLGYVIMPNHLHALLHFQQMKQKLNTIIGNAKRFLAYEIIKRLKAADQEDLLNELFYAVDKNNKKKGQLYRVFENSFDAKQCFTELFILQKLDYMHNNPVAKKWQLAEDFTLYQHSSAGFYHGTGTSAYKNLIHYTEAGIKLNSEPGVPAETPGER